MKPDTNTQLSPDSPRNDSQESTPVSNRTPVCEALGCTEVKPHGHLASGALLCGERLEAYCGFERGHDGRHAWDTGREFEAFERIANLVRHADHLDAKGMAETIRAVQALVAGAPTDAVNALAHRMRCIPREAWAEAMDNNAWRAIALELLRDEVSK